MYDCIKLGYLRITYHSFIPSLLNHNKVVKSVFKDHLNSCTCKINKTLFCDLLLYLTLAPQASLL